MRTFALAPVTDDHPPGLLTAHNAKEYTVGMSSEVVRRDGDHVAATLMVFDATAVTKMEKGKIDVSCGYECDLERKPGRTPTGEPYDAVQRNIRGNHIAIVYVGRAGSTRVRMDSAGLKQFAIMQPGGKVAMPIKKKKDLTIEEAAAQVAAAESRADASEAELADVKVRADRAEGELESVRTRLRLIESARADEEDPAKLQGIIKTLNAKINELSKDRARFDAEEPDRLRSAVRHRVKIESAAAAVLGGHTVFDSLDDRTIMTAVVEKLHGVSIPDDKSEDYVRARFDAAMEGFEANADALDRLKIMTQEKGEPITERMDSAAAHRLMVERNRNAWQAKKPDA